MPFARKRLALPVLIPLILTACTPDPVPPDMSTRESFAKSVMTTAASGSVEQVEKLAGDGQINVRPDAQRLVDFADGWNADPGEVKLGNDFPEVANVDATKEDLTATIRYRIYWSHGRWELGLGDPSNPPTGGAGLGPGSGTPKNIEPSR
jgi:hypothetical protein